jgi:hypothetical protein
VSIEGISLPPLSCRTWTFFHEVGIQDDAHSLLFEVKTNHPAALRKSTKDEIRKHTLFEVKTVIKIIKERRWEKGGCFSTQILAEPKLEGTPQSTKERSQFSKPRERRQLRVPKAGSGQEKLQKGGCFPFYKRIKRRHTRQKVNEKSMKLESLLFQVKINEKTHKHSPRFSLLENTQPKMLFLLIFLARKHTTFPSCYRRHTLFQVKINEKSMKLEF